MSGHNGQERRKSLLHRYGAQVARIKDRSKAELAYDHAARFRRMDVFMRKVVESSFDSIVTFREDGQLETANPAAMVAFGLKPEDQGRVNLSDIIPGFSNATGDTATLPIDLGHHEMTGRRSDGGALSLELAVSEIRADEGRRFVAVARDITERKTHESRLQHQALHDLLTGLPNRALLNDRLDHSLDLAKRMGEPMALLLLDLDRFKEVNDTLGHQVGDQVLIEVAGRLSQSIRTSDTIARLGGDEFAILLPAVSMLARARRVADRIVGSLCEPFHVVEGLELDIGISCGIALYPEHADKSGKLMQCADIAMYAAKNGKLGVAVYDHGADHNSVRHLTLTGELRNAIDQGQLDFEYQPKVDLGSNSLVSAEALARWIHPQHGSIPPDEFIMHAERTGLIEPLTHWAFTTAMKDLTAWNDQSLDISVAVNLSARNLHEEGLPDLLGGMLSDFSLSPEKLVLEITESAIMIDPDQAMIVVKRLADMGFRLSIDDFGTGYSSLSYLRHLPVHELKIDQSFVANMVSSESDLVIVRSTIDLAHNLGLTVVAEGIESARQVELLRGLGCDIGQGYFIGRPSCAGELAEWLRTSPWSMENPRGLDPGDLAVSSQG